MIKILLSLLSLTATAAASTSTTAPSPADLQKKLTAAYKANNTDFNALAQNVYTILNTVSHTAAYTNTYPWAKINPYFWPTIYDYIYGDQCNPFSKNNLSTGVTCANQLAQKNMLLSQAGDTTAGLLFPKNSTSTVLYPAVSNVYFVPTTQKVTASTTLDPQGNLTKPGSFAKMDVDPNVLLLDFLCNTIDPNITPLSEYNLAAISDPASSLTYRQNLQSRLTSAFLANKGDFTTLMRVWNVLL